MTKHYANTMDRGIEFFEINNNNYSINADANAPAGEPSVFINFAGIKTPVQSELKGFETVGELCFDTYEQALEVAAKTGFYEPAILVHPQYESFVEIA